MKAASILIHRLKQNWLLTSVVLEENVEPNQWPLIHVHVLIKTPYQGTHLIMQHGNSNHTIRDVENVEGLSEGNNHDWCRNQAVAMLE
ncbi:hypothetical protein V6N13_009395 [Hibiscus sabdariffa]|uniref:HIT domain-containing protein n=1 Tax=Hibiscus sabdariffa TaxID=183260 RepID=A0ABR2PP61_9ROSI